MQNAENIKKVCPVPNVSLIVEYVAVMKNAIDQLIAPATAPAMPLVSFANNSPIIIHGIGPANLPLTFFFLIQNESLFSKLKNSKFTKTK